jgi:hypothetical protein
MYNPVGSDNNGEYVEILFEVETNLEGWIIRDGDSSDVLVLLNGSGNSKLNLIIEEELVDFDLNLDDVSIYSAGKAIGNGLGNSGDEIYLHDTDANLVFEIDYNGDLANGNGKALCFDEVVLECDPSPGSYGLIYDDGEDSSEEVSEDEKINKSESSWIRINYVEVPENKCGNLKVGIELWNNRNKKEEISAYVRDVNEISLLKINPQRGQSIELPVATCGNIKADEGEYVLVVEGFGDEDYRLIWLDFEEEISMIEEDQNIVLNERESNINEQEEILIKSPTIDANNDENADLTLYLSYFVGGLGLFYWLKRD